MVTQLAKGPRGRDTAGPSDTLAKAQTDSAPRSSLTQPAQKLEGATLQEVLPVFSFLPLTEPQRLLGMQFFLKGNKN